MRSSSRRALAALAASMALVLVTGTVALGKKADGEKTKKRDVAVDEPEPLYPADYTSIEGLSEPLYETQRTSYEVRAHDGINIYVEVEMPSDAPEGARFPVILEASPYHGTIATRIGDRILPEPKEGGNSLGLSGYFAPRGYAVAFMDLRGTGKSEGCLDHLAGNDAKDLKTVIEWLADQPWSNGRIGMAGHSYVGATQVAAAAKDPRGLVTIVPSAGLGAMYDHQFQLGVPYFLQYTGVQWTYAALSVNRHLPKGIPGSFPFIGANPIGPSGDNFNNDMQYFGCGLQSSALTAGHGQATGMGQSWHAARDWRRAAAAWDGDVFMVHGTNDNAARIPAAEWFFKFRQSADHPGDKVWLGQWDHSSSQMNFRGMQWTTALHAWFDNKLMQLDVDTGPPVEVFLNDDAGGTPMGATTAIGAHEDVYTAPSWPGPQGSLTLYPNASDNSLALAPPEAAGTKTYTSAGVSAGTLTWNQPQGTFAEFTSAPLESETLLVGPPPTVKLNASVTGQRLNIITTLYAVADNGTRRAINYCAMNAELRNGEYTSSPIIPGQEMELEPQCFTIAGLVRAGESLVLRVGTVGPHHLGTHTVDAQVSIFTGPGKSSVTLPVAADPLLHPDVLAG